MRSPAIPSWPRGGSTTLTVPMGPRQRRPRERRVWRHRPRDPYADTIPTGPPRGMPAPPGEELRITRPSAPPVRMTAPVVATHQGSDADERPPLPPPPLGPPRCLAVTLRMPQAEVVAPPAAPEPRGGPPAMDRAILVAVSLLAVIGLGLTLLLWLS
jgi:hypothetical protein